MKPDTDQAALEEFEANYSAFIGCGLQATVFADEAFLREAGLYAPVEAILDAAGWKSLLTLRCAANVEDTCEFLASVALKGKYMRYRHRGVYYCASKKRLKRAFGWTTSRRDEPDQHSDDEAWRALTWSDKKFRAGRSLGSEICEPKFFYLQRLIANTVVARHNGAQRLGVLDMCVMKGLVYGTKVKFGDVLVEHWTRIRASGKIAAGGMISYYLRRTHGSDQAGQTVIQPEFLTKAKLSRMRAVKENEDGEVEWCYDGVAIAPINEGIPIIDMAVADAQVEEIAPDSEEDVAAAQGDAPKDAPEEQPVEQTPVRGRKVRTPVRTQEPTRRSARVRNQAGRASAQQQSSAQPQSSAQAEYPWMDPMAQRRWMFNVERVMEFAAPDFAIMNIVPPQDWMPGMPIPASYRMRAEQAGEENRADAMDAEQAAASSKSLSF